MRFIYIVLFSQLMIFLGKIAIEIIRSWILLHITARVNINIISDFILKLTKFYFKFKIITRQSVPLFRARARARSRARKKDVRL